MPSITLSKIEKQSKGRNGWFNPAKAAVKYANHETVCVEIWSRRETGEPPIDLYLTKADAGELAMLLMDGATDNLKKRDADAEFIRAKYGVGAEMSEAAAESGDWSERLHAVVKAAPEIAFTGGPIFAGDFKITIERGFESPTAGEVPDEWRDPISGNTFEDEVTFIMAKYKVGRLMAEVMARASVVHKEMVLAEPEPSMLAQINAAAGKVAEIEYKTRDLGDGSEENTVYGMFTGACDSAGKFTVSVADEPHDLYLFEDEITGIRLLTVEELAQAFMQEG